MLKSIIFVFLLFAVTGFQTVSAKEYILQSPDKQIKARIKVNNTIQYELFYKNKQYLLPSEIAMTLDGGETFGKNVKVVSVNTRSVNQIVHPVYGISSSINDNFNELEIKCKGNYSVFFRIYNEGFAYRFSSRLNRDVLVISEQSDFHFADNYNAYFHPQLSESDYRPQAISDKLKPNYSSLPLLVETPEHVAILIHESDVFNFPCLTVKSATQLNSLAAEHTAYPKQVKEGGYKKFNLQVTETENYIAKTTGNRNFPWRIVAFQPDDKSILTNQIVYLLASESKLKDVSWIKPGKVVWDWWNSLNLTGVNFKTGFNTETYKYLIDFAAANKIEYINLDEGWSDQYNLLKLADKLDMEELVKYARQKHVGVILWCVWRVLDKQMPEALSQFKKWGIAGLKVDFMDRDDQVVVEFQERLLKEAAKANLLVNYHGAYHPTGMARTYPNNINVEGVKGMEWDKFDPAGTSPLHDVTIPFIRMFAGSMDFTPGAMQNYNKTDWKQIFDRPMSQGTRAHQMAMYTVYYGPLQMLSDAPTAYEREPEILEFLSSVPTIWDETVPLDSKTASYVTVARRKGSNWYIGSMTNWDPKTLSLKMNFLQDGKTYNAEIIADGVNASRVGNDYQLIKRKVKRGDVLEVSMAAGGGWTCRLTPAN